MSEIDSSAGPLLRDRQQARERLESIRQWLDILNRRAGIFEQQLDLSGLKHMQTRLSNLWLEVDPTYSIGINGPPETSMGSTAMSEREEQGE